MKKAALLLVFLPVLFSPGSSYADLSLKKFAAIQAGTQVQLSWTTYIPCSHSSFRVERSPDGHSFEDLGTLTGGENPDFTEFGFADQQPPEGTVYYRLRAAEDTSYSTIIAVTYQRAAEDTKMWLSQASGNVQIAASGFLPGSSSLCIVDLAGRICYSGSLEIQESGRGLLELRSSGAVLLPGIYVVCASNEGKPIQQKFVIR
jgi:hypothetical protein